MRRDRAFHALTALVVGAALLLQLVLVVDGAATLLPAKEPTVPVRLLHFVSYFTILSNALVLVTTVPLVRTVPAGRVWRVLRLDAVVAITVTGVVHWFVLRPLLDLHGASYVADKLLHVVCPLLAVVGWAVFGPRGRVGREDLLPSLAYPGLWVVYILLLGAGTGWYPYPFVDANQIGYVRVAVNCLAVAALLLAVSTQVIWLDGRLPDLSRGASGTTPRRPTDRT